MMHAHRLTGRGGVASGSGSGPLGGVGRMFTWSARLLIAAAAAVALWFVTPAVLRSGAAHALLSLAMFVGVAIVLALLPWPRERQDPC